MKNELTSTVLQIAAFTLIPFLFFLVRYRKTRGFFSWIGLRRANKTALIWAAVASVLGAGSILLPFILEDSFKALLYDPKSVTGSLMKLSPGRELIGRLMLISLFKTSLSEEILFRGFIAKRLMHWLGFQKANLIQAGLFGLIHTLFFASMTQNIVWLFLIFLMPATIGWGLMYINEKKAEGSILPGWLAHGFGNLFSYLLIYFW